MAEPIQIYDTRVSGYWNPRHTILDRDGVEMGVLSVRRNGFGMVVAGEYRPEKGEVLFFRRDPGLLRAQFSIWTDGREWLGSSMRWNVIRRQIDAWTGSRPYRIVPRQSFGCGWRLVASKTGVVAQILPKAFRRSSRIEVYRKMDFELVLFSYFLGSIILRESFFPSSLDFMHSAKSRPAKAPSPSKA